MSFPGTTITHANTNQSKVAASIEISPKHALEMEHLETMIPTGTSVYITDVGTHDTSAMVIACRRLVELGFNAVPHIAARRLTTENELENRIKRYADAGVYDVLVIGGGMDKPVGDYSSTMEVLESGFLDANGIKEIGIAGHPEGSPDFSDEVAMAALRLKMQFSERTDAKIRIVTQFGFDAELFINWAENLKEAGIDIPVHLGVAGPAKITTLIKYAALCGVGNSISFLKKRASILTTLATSHSPESVVGPIESHVIAAQSSAIKGVHAFPFGGVKKTSQWLAERGSWPQAEPQFVIANGA